MAGAARAACLNSAINRSPREARWERPFPRRQHRARAHQVALEQPRGAGARSQGRREAARGPRSTAATRGCEITPPPKSFLLSLEFVKKIQGVKTFFWSNSVSKALVLSNFESNETSQAPSIQLGGSLSTFWGMWFCPASWPMNQKSSASGPRVGAPGSCGHQDATHPRPGAATRSSYPATSAAPPTPRLQNVYFLLQRSQMQTSSRSCIRVYLFVVQPN